MMNGQESMNFLTDCIGAHEGGTTIKLGYDDATHQYFMSYGQWYSYGGSLQSALQMMRDKHIKQTKMGTGLDDAKSN
jgi:hypothetical protein